MLGHVVDGQMIPNDVGEMIHRAWVESPQHCEGILLEEFVVMPNHLHGIVVLTGEATHRPLAGSESVWKPLTTTALPEIVRRFKTLTTMKYREQTQRVSTAGE